MHRRVLSGLFLVAVLAAGFTQALAQQTATVPASPIAADAYSFTESPSSSAPLGITGQWSYNFV